MNGRRYNGGQIKMGFDGLIRMWLVVLLESKAT